MPFANSFKTFPVLETARLILSEIDSSEAEVYHHEQCSALDQPGRAPWEYGFETQSVETARASIGFAQNAWKKKSKIRFGVRLKHDGPPVLIGCCELFGIENQYKAEVGYWLGAEHQGKGYMPEAMKAMITYAFVTLGLGRLFAQTSPRNLASINMLQKLGFIQEGVLRQSTRRGGVWDDSVVMALLASDPLPESKG